MLQGYGETPKMNPESELSKAIAQFIKADLDDIFTHCFMLLALMTLTGGLMGGCAIDYDYRLKKQQYAIEVESK